MSTELGWSGGERRQKAQVGVRDGDLTGTGAMQLGVPNCETLTSSSSHRAD